MKRLSGTVIKIVGTTSHVDTLEGVVLCDLRARLFRQLGVRLAVGDLVSLTTEDAESENDRGVIDAVEPRRSSLRRVRDLKRNQVLCANVDQIFVVVAILDPPYKRAFIDRLLVRIEQDRLEGVVVFNKMDLADEPYAELVAEDAAVYEDLGYRTLRISAVGNGGLGELIAAFSGRISAVVGPSGVGKSTLLNAICPELKLRTGEVSVQDGRGKHTTSSAELVRLPGAQGGFVVDTPGLRGFGLWDLTPEEIVDGFRELAAFRGRCRFRNCAHKAEPECAVREGVESGEIDHERYESYLRLMEEVEAGASERQASRRR